MSASACLHGEPGVSQLAAAGSSAKTTTTASSTTRPSTRRCRGSWTSFGRLRRNNEAAFARYLATEEGRRAVLVTLVSDVATVVLPAAGARPAARDRAAHARAQRPDGRCTTRTRLDGGVSNRLEVDSGGGQPCADRRLDPGDRAADRRFSRTRSACSPGVRPERSPAAGRSKNRRRRPVFRSVFRPRCSSGGPTSSRPSSCSSRPMPTSAPPRRCSTRRSASPVRSVR